MSTAEPEVIAALIGGLLTLSASVFAVIMTIVNRRDTTAQRSAHEAIAHAQNRLIERLHADQERNDRMTGQLQSRVTVLERLDGEKASRIMVLTEWGRWATGHPPRTPPPWLEDHTS